ncbi:hypothetical protein RFI_24664 [Reticulomyxa filosa]|uniref:Uncharacterized protein n=1 Tax=Reticulomyxa filosa TaxID=46433 RepID=X6MFB3_RETFI|nr:hypothetical protein RFI_24664 [Reticulomyxa filosa]|eukprot:ETO12708.1 hypothetical protein RFI_24664 [Reticulomyxa filosa]
MHTCTHTLYINKLPTATTPTNHEEADDKKTNATELPTQSTSENILCEDTGDSSASSKRRAVRRPLTRPGNGVFNNLSPTSSDPTLTLGLFALHKKTDSKKRLLNETYDGDDDNEQTYVPSPKRQRRNSTGTNSPNKRDLESTNDPTSDAMFCSTAVPPAISPTLMVEDQGTSSVSSSTSALVTSGESGSTVPQVPPSSPSKAKEKKPSDKEAQQQKEDAEKKMCEKARKTVRETFGHYFNQERCLTLENYLYSTYGVGSSRNWNKGILERIDDFLPSSDKGQSSDQSKYIQINGS